ncbi:MAG: hypothetical protein QNJ72_34875 [Pleurocapsa sp. MO_226.B13]|nr:hypothetical protein [Pleurocapsa sp. MO_226.B13]
MANLKDDSLCEGEGTRNKEEGEGSRGWEEAKTFAYPFRLQKYLHTEQNNTRGQR